MAINIMSSPTKMASGMNTGTTSTPVFLLSIIVGYLSPLLGIGGGIIHVPALANWLQFPVHVATATSHFILAVMATVSVITNIVKGSYNDLLWKLPAWYWA